MKDEFKAFVRSKPELIKYVDNGKETWQKIYEKWALYGSSNSIWDEYKKQDEKINLSSINDFIKKIRNNIYFLSGLNFLINYKNYDIKKIIFEINKIKNNYDFILIDTNSNIFLEENIEIFNFCDQLILLNNADDIEMNKTEKINNFLLNNIKIDNKKINVI